MRVCCVIVTYNRKKLLLECINSILKQTISVNDIIVIDNNSNDGTEEYLNQNNLMSLIKYKKLNENIGGAGGFNIGVKEALKKEYDWIWIMDDDTIPTVNALEELLKSYTVLKNERVSFLCSKVIGIDNEEMNIPIISQRNGENGYPIWMKYLDKSIVEVKAATFVSVLIKYEAVKQVGLPWRQFFIWGDDIEYTSRLNKYYGPGYSIGKSIVIHKRIGAKNLSIIDEDSINRIKMYKYLYRNNIFVNSYEKPIKQLKLMVRQFIDIIKIMVKSKKYKLKKASIVLCATLNGIFNIKLKKEFKNRMIIE